MTDMLMDVATRPVVCACPDCPRTAWSVGGICTCHYIPASDGKDTICKTHNVLLSAAPQTHETAAPQPTSTAAQSDVEPFDLTQIPYEADRRVAAIFSQGDAKYTNRYFDEHGALTGHGNWRKGVGDTRYQLDRANHALKHLKMYVHWLEFGEDLGEPGEDNLAKVRWFCDTQMELERLEKVQKGG